MTGRDWTRRELLGMTAGTLVARPSGVAGAAAYRSIRPREHGTIVYNTDPDGIQAPSADTPQGFLATRFTPIIDTEVGTVAQCTGTTTIFTHAVPVGEDFGQYTYRGESDAVRAATCEADPICSARYRNINALRRAHTDVLRLGLAFCRRHGLHHAFSFRVNDVHDSFEPWALSAWKRTHPQYLLARPGESADPDTPRYWWTALDFEQRAVRAYLYAILAGICGRYDLDSLELDYFRSPLLFRPNLDGRPATERQAHLLTAWQRSLRLLTGRIAARRRRAFPLQARVPATVSACRHVGIDIERWLAEGLVQELRLGGGYMPFTEPIGELAVLARRHGVRVQAVISASGLPAPYDTIDAWRGAAANGWRAGVDGIYTFNFFPSGRDRRMLELGSPRTLAGRDKLFAIEPEPILQGFTRQATVQRAILPAEVPVRRWLPVGDDIPMAARKRMLRDAVLRVRLSDPALVEAADVRLNGRPLTPRSRDRVLGWLTFAPPAHRWRLGLNELDFIRGRSSPVPWRPTAVTAVELSVRYLR